MIFQKAKNFSESLLDGTFASAGGSYKIGSVCPPVHPSVHSYVRPSIRPSVRPSVCPQLFLGLAH